MTKMIWQKPYRGPFNPTEARAIAQDLMKVANPDINLIYDVRIRKRPKLNKYDVYILTRKD